jgi:hypothetical protein
MHAYLTLGYFYIFFDNESFEIFKNVGSVGHGLSLEFPILVG